MKPSSDQLSLFLAPPPPNVPIRPFLKWAGGKFKLLPRIFAALPPARGLIEPFTGSAVVALNAPYAQVLARDSNPDLIDLYTHAQRRTEALIAEAEALFTPANNSQDAFLTLRAEFNAAPPGLRRAALFIYLNRHGFNGLCRYNARGGFNVPFGRYASSACPTPEIRRFAARTTHVHFSCGDFEELMEEAGEGDAVYCDQPYAPLSATASFANT